MVQVLTQGTARIPAAPAGPDFAEAIFPPVNNPAMQHEPTDAQVIAASLDDREEFGLLFDRYYARVHAFIRMRLGVSLADDIAAETFCTAFQKRDSFDLQRCDARPWLFGIAFNLMRRHLRGESRRLRAYARHGADPVWSPLDGAAERADAAAAGHDLAKALSTLTRGDRDVLLLHAWADLTHGEIAEALGIPVGTVKSRLSRARKQMCEVLPDQLEWQPEAEGVER
jgi:RNA polymerase sigma-70 factor (ECF subfamily)